ncbi:hypothetical protein [Bradyrhizobium japonicum]|uniref:hypothetical protein n=1 Tax=Bradyrhizobium japonicum TaxID=375 RepID=UPI000A9FC66F|nr:hypothetical protein [Bradyrhizobium japonicum]
MRIGAFISSNLTPAGSLAQWSDGEIFRAIRNSVGANWLMIMSYTSANMLSDDDVKAVIAYLRTLPRSGGRTPEPPDRFNLLGLAMLGADLLPAGKPISTGTITSPPPGGDGGIWRVPGVIFRLPRLSWPGVDRRRAGADDAA